MIYCSADIESSSLVPSPDHILGVALVVEDSNNPRPLKDLPKFVCLVRHEEIKGQAYALGLNSWILDAISGRATSQYNILNAKSFSGLKQHGLNGFYDLDTWHGQAHKFLDEHFGRQRITIAGKNVAGFDMQFFPDHFKSRFRHRAIDVGSVMIDWTKNTAPSLDELLVKIDPTRTVSHDMYHDALDVIELLRTTYPKKGG